MFFLFNGILLGFSIAAPVGPIGILCIRRTLAKGMYYGFVSGLGAATADAIYGLVAVLGLSAVSDVLLNQQLFLRLGGGLFLLYLSLKNLRSAPAQTTISIGRDGLLAAYFSTLLLTLTNPMTILSFAAIFAGFGIAESSGLFLPPLLLVLGVFLGSLLWWLILSGTINRFRQNFNPQQLKWVNHLSALILFGFAIYCLSAVFPR